MKKLLKPTRFKVMFTLGLMTILLSVFLTNFKVHDRDTTVNDFILYPFTELPMMLFDLATGSAFAATGCLLFCGPSLPGIIFVLVFDIALFYLLACVLASLFKKRGAAAQTQNHDL